MKPQNICLNSQRNPEKKRNEARGITLPDFELYPRETIIKTVWCW